MVYSERSPPNEKEGDMDSSNKIGIESNTLSYLEYFEVCERIHYASVIDGITPLNSNLIQARCTRVNPNYLRPVTHERVYVVNLDANFITLPQSVVSEVIDAYAITLLQPRRRIKNSQGLHSKFCFVSPEKNLLLYTNLDFVLYLIPNEYRFDHIQLNDIKYILTEIDRSRGEIPFTYELSMVLLLRSWFQGLFSDDNLSKHPDDVEASILEQFWWVQSRPLSRTLPSIPRVKSKDLVQYTSSAYRYLRAYLFSILWGSKSFSLSEDERSLKQKVLSWKKIQHLNQKEPIEWTNHATNTIFRGLRSRSWKFSSRLQLGATITSIGAKPKIQFQNGQLRGSRTLEAARFGSHDLNPVNMFGFNKSILFHLNNPEFVEMNPWLEYIINYYEIEYNLSLFLLHFASQLAVFQTCAAMEENSRLNLKKNLEIEFFDEKIILYHVPKEAKFKHIALGEDVIPASILVDLLNNDGERYSFFLVYSEHEYIEEMPINVFIDEIKSSYPEFYERPDAFAKLSEFKLPSSLQGYPFQLACSNILTPSEGEVDEESFEDTTQPKPKEGEEEPTQEEFTPEPDNLDEIAQESYDSNFFGYQQEKKEGDAKTFNAETNEFEQVYFTPPNLDSMYEFYESWEHLRYFTKISIIENKLKDQMPDFLFKEDEPMEGSELFFLPEEEDEEEEEEGVEEGEEEAENEVETLDDAEDEDEKNDGDGVEENEEEASNEVEDGEQVGAGEDSNEVDQDEGTDTEELTTYSYERPPSDFLLLEIKRYDIDTRKFVNRERLCLINVDTIKPNLDFPQYFIEVALHQLANANNESGEKYFKNDNLALIFVSLNERKLLKVKPAFLFHFNMLIDAIPQLPDSKLNLDLPDLPVSDLDNIFLTIYKIYLEYFVFLSANITISPVELRTLLNLPPEIINSFKPLASTILDFQYFSNFWEGLWDAYKEREDNSLDEEGEEPEENLKEKFDEFHNIELLKHALSISKNFFVPPELKDFKHPLVDLFSQFNEQELHYILRLTNISDQVYQFETLQQGAEVEQIFVIDRLDYQQYNVFAYGRKFQELLFDEEDHEGVLYFIVDLETRSIMEVEIGFFRKFLFGKVSLDATNDMTEVNDFKDMLVDLQQRLGDNSELQPFNLNLKLRFVLRHLEYLLDGLGRVDFYEDFTQGVFHLWRYHKEGNQFIEVTWDLEDDNNTF